MKRTFDEIAYIRTEYGTKFGVPRQSGLVDTEARIVFLPEYRKEGALRGITGFSHLWIVWVFSEAVRDGWSPTVRPPRLGGNRRMGVFATRSPFRPNPIALSCVKLLRTEETDEGTVLVVSGADMSDGTPILDIKPYLPFTDAHPEASSGWTESCGRGKLSVVFRNGTEEGLSPETLAAVTQILSGDPRPAYRDEPERVFGFAFGEYDVRFTVSDGTATVCEIKKPT